MTNLTQFNRLLRSYQDRAEKALDHWLPPADLHPAYLHEAMRYAVLDGGKRIRPVLAYATGQALGVELEQLDGPACAVEIIHAYSLIHDDMPAMDNDDLRRGKPTCHKAYGEATALLAGDALQALSFYILAHDDNMNPDPTARLKMVESLGLSSGSRGMAGGQAIDLNSTGKQIDLAELEYMHIHKTGALIRSSVTMGALSAANIDGATLKRLDHYANCVGLAFQIRDDILDVEGDTETLGKTQGKDMDQDKATYPALMGMSEAKAEAQNLHDQAIESLSGFDQKADPLRWISEYIIQRGN